MPLPVAFDGFIEQSKRVSPTCLICFERTRYEPCRASGLRGPIRGHGPFAPIANRPISLRIYPDRLVVVLKARLRRDAAEGQILCEHPRIIERSHHLSPRTIYDWRHYLAPRHCPRTNGGQWLDATQARRSSQWRALPGIAIRLQTVTGADGSRRPGGDREMVDILARSRITTRRPCSPPWKWLWPRAPFVRGRDQDPCAEPGSHRLIDGKVHGGPPLDTPQALALRREPKANVDGS